MFAGKAGCSEEDRDTVEWYEAGEGRKEKEEANGRGAATGVLIHGLVTQKW